MFRTLHTVLVSFLLLGRPVGSDHGEWKAVKIEESQADLFEISPLISVIGPTRFPKPTDKLDDQATVIVEPTYGRHRSDNDVILAYAEGYTLPYYMMFMESLTATGFRGDVVLAIADERIVKEDVVDYLRTFTVGDPNQPALVIYQQPLDCDGENHERAILKSGTTDVFQMCRLTNVYGWKDEKGNIIKKAADPREGRVVATLRYEWYWIWANHYNPHSWIMLVDARDAYFQTNPFANLPRNTTNAKDGLLYFFGENAAATRLGKSNKNMKWLRNGYGDATLQALKDKPTICSGSTMGEQIAIETYLRALINEHDECDIRMTGSDQGFHNFLYYSGKLLNAEAIREIIVWEQGRGIINNLGALRTKTFEEWGFYNPTTHAVFQWDGETLSPVVHQWDRDKHLHSWMTTVMHKDWQKEWQMKKMGQNGNPKKIT